jgi:tRNA/rRNA methyltransferase
MVHNLRAIFTRASLSSQEIRTLRGVISSIDRMHLRQGRQAKDVQDEGGEE